MQVVSTLGLCLLGFALPALALGGLLLQPARRVRWLRAAPFALAALGAGLAWALDLWLAPVALGALACLFLATASALGSRFLDRLRGALSRTQVQWCVLCVAGPALATAAFLQAQNDGPPPFTGPPANALAGFDPASLRPVKAAQAVTDAGNPVALHRVTTPPSPQQLREYEDQLIKNMAGEFISTAGRGGVDSNCHGWVFTGGRFWVHGEAVNQIVKDNGYREAKQPRAGDLVVYREADGKVIHSGVVRYVDEEGQALVESKWGVASRFLHPVDRHCYAGANHFFYRSARRGHLLQGLDDSSEGAPGGPVPVSQAPVRDPASGAVAVASAEAHGTPDQADAD
jgi:hypothetical protein